ncbi:MAG: putative serine esterase [Acidobacteriaceae bacterium]|nr:putative serine esterase [Acidobacteriaceae bacterium]
MHNPLHSVFGTTSNNLKAPAVYLRHGFLSDGHIFQTLETRINSSFPGSLVDRTTYDWKAPVVINGLRLAHEVLNGAGDRPVFLVGHSMGGLISRVAAIALHDPAAMLLHLNLLPAGWNFDPAEARSLCSTLQKRAVAGVVTLATPNSGAVTHGQMSLLAYFFRRSFSSHAASIVDLTTDHLFRFLQRYAVDIPTLSISGSAFSVFSKQAQGPMRIAMGLKMPNDGIVEDASVDLTQSVLPNEVVNSPSAHYLHVRAYPDCTDVWHTDIHGNVRVQEFVVEFISLT